MSSMEESLVPVQKVSLAKSKGGRPKKGNKTPYLLPVLQLDTSKNPLDQVLPCEEKKQATHLDWRVNEVRSVNSNLGLYTSLPMVCQASGCFWASQCPTRPDFAFKGRLCPLEIIEAYKFFVGYVRDLGIKPTDYVDLRLVEDLIRIDLQLRQVDQRLQLQGMESDTVGGVAQGTGTAIWEKTSHPLLATQDKLRNRRREIHKSLIASKVDKKELERKEGKQKVDTLALWNRISDRIDKNTTMNEKSGEFVIEGQLVDEEDWEDTQ